MSPNIFPQELVVLLSAKLHISDFGTKKSVSFMKMLHNKGLRIDPCSIPEITSRQSLKTEPIFVPCL